MAGEFEISFGGATLPTTDAVVVGKRMGVGRLEAMTPRRVGVAAVLLGRSGHHHHRTRRRRRVPQAGGDGDGGGGPWEISPYFTKKLRRQTDSLGQFVGEEEDGAVADPVGWNEEAKRRLKIERLHDLLSHPEGDAEHSMSPQEVEAKIQTLTRILPTLQVTTMKADVLARLIREIDDVCSRVINLKSAFPYADVSRLASRNLFLLLSDWAFVEENLEGVRSAVSRLGLSDDEAARLFAQSPEVVDCVVLEQVLEDLARLFGDRAKSILLSNPDVVLGLQNLEHQARGNYEL